MALTDRGAIAVLSTNLPTTQEVVCRHFGIGEVEVQRMTKQAEEEPMHEIAVQRAFVGACRASLRAIRDTPANTERRWHAERALDRAESELYLLETHDSAQLGGNPLSAA
jgi:DNA-binding transcriptional regulator LsrR (DeoR family)